MAVTSGFAVHEQHGQITWPTRHQLVIKKLSLHIGDSITRGARDLNYPLLMQRDELGDAWRVANYGVSGASLKRGETGVGKPFVDDRPQALDGPLGQGDRALGRQSSLAMRPA